MSKLKELCERMSEVAMTAGILESATEFVKMNAGDTYKGSEGDLCAILYLLQQTAKRIADEMAEVEILANAVEAAI